MQWHELRCPKCGQDDKIYVTATVAILLTPDGSGADNGDHEWDESSPTLCHHCDTRGQAKDFKVEKTHNVNTFTFTPTLNIPIERIADLVVTAVEGGSTDWLKDLHLKSLGGVLPPSEPSDTQTWYARVPVYADPDAEIVAQTKLGIAFLKRSEWEKGLLVFASEYTEHFADFLSDNEDATTADVFMQCVIFGECVFD